MKKIIALLILIVGIFSSGCTSINNDQTTNWLTYTNKKYSYTIDYPKDWNINTALGLNNVQIVSPDKSKDTLERGQSIFIKYLETQDELNNITDKKELIINGIKAIQGLDDNAMYTVRATCFPYGSHLIKIWWADDFTNETYNQILSTFRIIE